MSLVYYHLDQRMSFQKFLNQPDPAHPGDYFDAVNPLPGVGGIYVIWNGTHATNNVYIGVAQDIHKRFNPRAEAMVHLGFTFDDLKELVVWYGTVHYWPSVNTLGVPAPAAGPWGSAAVLHAPNPLLPNIKEPNTALPNMGAGYTLPNYSPPSHDVSVDPGASINLVTVY